MDTSNFFAQHSLVLGVAGSGKTTLIKKIIDENPRGNIKLLAFTGIAARNMRDITSHPAQTIHSFFNLPITNFFDNNFVINSRLSYHKKILLIIDEISIVSSSLMSALLRHLLKFPKLKLLLMGDISQLAPIIPESSLSLYDKYYNGGVYFFNAPEFNLKNFNITVLTKIYRQTDSQLKCILSNIRNNKITQDDLNILNTRHKPLGTYYDKDVVYLCTKNRFVDEINNHFYNFNENKEYTFYRHGGKLKDISKDKKYLKLKKGCKILITANNRHEGYVNGDMGIVEDITFKNNDYNIFVKLLENNKIIELKRKDYPNNITKTIDIGDEFNTTRQKQIIEKLPTTKQFPFKLGNAITIHRVQGLTLNKMYIVAGKVFATNMLYVALSRVRKLEDILINRKLVKEDFFVDERVNEFLKKIEYL